MNSPELIRPATRTALRNCVSNIEVQVIDDAFRDEGFTPARVTAVQVSGARRQQAQHYLEAVDWTDQDHVRRALRVFERLLRRIERSAIVRDELLRLLDQDGYELNDDERLVPVGPTLNSASLQSLRDRTAIVDQLTRLARAVASEDPVVVIGAAKELVESTAKTVLLERGVAFDERRDDLPKLVDAAQRALLLHPQNAGSDEIAKAVKTALGGAKSLVQGLTELRNRAGAGHGGGRVGLGDRHSRLAVNAARTWCELMLDTFADPRAPWRAASQQS